MVGKMITKIILFFVLQHSSFADLQAPYDVSPTTSPPIKFECTDQSHTEVRTFDSLEAYQGSKQSFYYGGSGYISNYVSFNFKSLEVIPSNAFISFDSNYVMKLFLDGKGIKRIEEKAFKSIFCLRVLSLKDNNITSLTPGIFKDLPNLKELYLTGNNLFALQDDLFEGLGSLLILDLGRNNIRFIGVKAFNGLQSLRILNLANNKLMAVQNDVFSPLRSLENLDLSSNSLSNIQPEKWRNLTFLNSLNLANNPLAKFSFNYNFSFASLASLNLSSTGLTKLNVYGLKKYLSNLKTMDLNDNNFYCEDLHTITYYLEDARINLMGNYDSINQVKGIACSITQDTYTERTSTQKIITTKITATAESNSLKKSAASPNEDVLTAIKKTQHLVVLLIIIVVIFVALDLTVRTGVLNRIYNFGGKPQEEDSSNIEQIGLLQK